MLKYLIVILSFFFESALSIFFYKDTLFLNLFSLLSLYVVYPFFKNDKKRFFILTFILGFIYDLVLNSVFGVNLILFLFLSLIFSWIHDNFSETFFNSFFISVLILIIYRFGTYLIFIKMHHLTFDLFMFSSSIYSTLILDTIYIILMHILLKKRKSKLK